jgi:hypothetical protein
MGKRGKGVAGEAEDEAMISPRSTSKADSKGMPMSPSGRSDAAEEAARPRGPGRNHSKERTETSENPAGPQSEVQAVKKSAKKEERREDKSEKSAKKLERKERGEGKEGVAAAAAAVVAAAAAADAVTATRVALPVTAAGTAIEAQASLALSRDGKAVLVSWLNKVEILSPVSRKRLLSLEGHSAAVTAVCVHPLNVSQAYTASFDGTIRLWDISDGANLKQWNVHQPIFQLVISSDAQHAYVTILKGVATEGNKSVSYVHQVCAALRHKSMQP